MASFSYLCTMEMACSLFDSIEKVITSQEVTLWNAVAKLALSIMLGALVGWERKRKGQVAGVRTFALISMGACMAMLLSIYVPQEYLGLKNGDPGRIAAQVITGVGFIGGGVMIRMRGSVRGLTTAAGIWMVATIGMAVGVGMYLTSIIATIMILIVLIGFEWWEHRKKIGQETKALKIAVEGIVDDITPYRKLFVENAIHLSTFYIKCKYAENRTELDFVVMMHKDTDCLKIFDKIRALFPTVSISLSSQVDI